MVWGCSNEVESPQSIIKAYKLDAPDYFGDPIEHSENKLTVQGVALGKKLFFDPILSSNQEVSCGSCHQQEVAFADANGNSTGVSGKSLERNSPALFNLAWQETFFWEGGAKNLESQALGPLMHPDEMNAHIPTVIERLKNHPEYPSLFQEAFADTIKSKYLYFALAQFQKSLISQKTSYDLNLVGEYAYSSEELQGKFIFEQHCESCHHYPHFSSFHYFNNGLDSVFNFNDPEDLRWGRYRITLKDSDKGKYKVPSLRNSALTPPYMHDGRFSSLEEVINHYSNGIVVSNYTDKQLPAGGFQFTEEEKKALISFLTSLTDEQFITNPDYRSLN